MITQLAWRIRGATLLMSPEHLVDKFLDWIEELRSAMSLAETDRLVRNELRTRMLFD
jgi:hypothetical protein